MDEHLNRHILENFDVSGNHDASSQDSSKTNAPGVLRGVDGNGLHFITVSGRDQDYIDNNLLNPEYITTHIPNGFIIDFISNQDGSESHQQTFINEPLSTDIVFPNDDQDRKLTASLLSQLVDKQSQSKISNEAPVIVSNKDIGSLGPISLCNKAHSDVQNFLTMEEQQQLTQTLLNDHQFKMYQSSASSTSSSQMFSLPLPPLTPIRIPNISSKGLNVEPDVVIKKEFYDNLDDFEGNNDASTAEVQLKSQKTVAKKTLPHKKRIVKKLKNIDKVESKSNSLYDVPDDEDTNQQNSQFSCQLCGVVSESQIDFFSHLKVHYEPSSSSTTIKKFEKNDFFQSMEMSTEEHLRDVEINFVNFSDESLNHEKDVSDSIVPKEPNNQELNDHPLTKNSLQTDEVEFSDTEDMLEGIRGVVDKVQESVDNDSNDDIDMINDKTWYNNSALNGNIHFKTDLDSTNNQSLSTVVENFSIFLKNNLDKSEDKNEMVLSTVPELEVGNTKLEDMSSTDNTATTTANNRKNEVKDIKPTAADLVSSLSTMTTRKSSKRTESTKTQSSKPPRKPQVKKPPLHSNDSDDSVDDLFEESCEDPKSKKRKIKCHQCGKVLNSVNALKYHDLSHTGERPHQCKVCEKSFFALSALKVHMRLHSGDKPYKCEICKRAFRQWGDLKYHTISIHTDVRNFQCEFCGKAFARRYSLVIHRRIHTSERNYKCEFCSKTFRASSYLQNHRKVHTGEKPYSCKICGKKFRVSGDLNRHVKIHTREKTKKGATKSTTSSVSEPIQESSYQEGYIITEVNPDKTETDPQKIQMVIVKEESKSMEINLSFVYDSDMNMFKTVPELDTPSLLETIPIEETPITSRIKRSPSDNQISNNKLAIARKSTENSDTSLATKSSDEVDIGKPLSKSANFVYFW